MRSPKNESFSGDRMSAHIKARASQPKTLSKYYGHPYSFRIFCGNRNFLRIQIRRALPITDRHALLRLPERRRKGRHAPLRPKTEKKETRNRCAILGGIHRCNTVRNVFLAAMCRHKNARERTFPYRRRCRIHRRGWRPLRAQGAPAIEGLRPYEDWLRQYFYPLPIPNKKRTSHMRGSYTLPEFIPKNPSSPIWRNDFG